jgi:D-ribose pyranose/furanose isomerase RbsD
VLVSAGKPIVDIGLSEQEYNTMVADAIRTGDDSPFANVIDMAVAQKEIAFGVGGG